MFEFIGWSALVTGLVYCIIRSTQARCPYCNKLGYGIGESKYYCASCRFPFLEVDD